MPWPSEQLLSHNIFWEKQSFHRLLDSLLVWSFHPNVMTGCYLSPNLTGEQFCCSPHDMTGIFKENLSDCRLLLSTVHVLHILPVHMFDHRSLRLKSNKWNEQGICSYCSTVQHGLHVTTILEQHIHRFHSGVKQQVLEHYILCHMFYRTCFTVYVLPYTFYCAHFSEIPDRSCNYKSVKLPSGCVVPGSRSVNMFGCCFVNCRGGADEVDHFRLSGPPGLSTMPGWYKVCEIGRSEQQVHLQPLCCIWSSGCSFGFCIPVSSLQYQLIGKLKGRGSHPHRWARQNWSDVCLWK